MQDVALAGLVPDTYSADPLISARTHSGGRELPISTLKKWQSRRGQQIGILRDSRVIRQATSAVTGPDGSLPAEEQLSNPAKFMLLRHSHLRPVTSVRKSSVSVEWMSKFPFVRRITRSRVLLSPSLARHVYHP
jgi:hypothetical protein